MKKYKKKRNLSISNMSSDMLVIVYQEISARRPSGVAKVRLLHFCIEPGSLCTLNHFLRYLNMFWLILLLRYINLLWYLLLLRYLNPLTRGWLLRHATPQCRCEPSRRFILPDSTPSLSHVLVRSSLTPNICCLVWPALS